MYRVYMVKYNGVIATLTFASGEVMENIPVSVKEFKTGTKSKKIQDAKDKVNDLKILKTPNQKIRIIEYHNDESDENRTPCIILEEI